MIDAPSDSPPSPCTQVCMLDADDICLGCGRTLDEIAAWGTLTPAEQRAVAAEAEQRRGG
ncbi:DUF1289 domain-containing protein [Sphingomonas oligophenolica]|uniref:DUF1289 domain-containing protein n=1 Tax=Sphingomonas oligophenolica TaxID=301154 RepID=A0A502CQZ2_9SPHN|nr:DUF1289 domain-containing protein [Sphingomonas oligophenolica]TPG15298.1 DUF1289 domain-containing protein [Sphingomonas oligophenolica]